jgi:hypothetical protein
VLRTFCRDYRGHSVFATVAGETIESTSRHPYWVVRGEDLAARPCMPHLPPVAEGATTPGRWVDAGDLRIGDELLLRDGRILPVQGLRSSPYHANVYNFEVEDLHCYTVGPSGVLVHNNNGGPVPFEEEYGSLADALGEVNPDAVEIVDRVPTVNDNIRALGYTETIYATDSTGEQFSVFYNPTTGTYAGAH